MLYFTLQVQFVLWFAGLRGIISFALALNVPGADHDVCFALLCSALLCFTLLYSALLCSTLYSVLLVTLLYSALLCFTLLQVIAAATLIIVMLSIVIFGGGTAPVLMCMGMIKETKEEKKKREESDAEGRLVCSCMLTYADTYMLTYAVTEGKEKRDDRPTGAQ